MAQVIERKEDGVFGLAAEIIKRAREKRDRRQLAGKKPKLILIEPKAPGRHIYSALKLPRLGAVLLATIAREYGWDARVYVEEIAAINYRDVLTADMVGLSSITSTARRAYAIADALRPFGIPVVMGGPHVTFLADEALEHCDYVVRGEGEEALPALLRAWQSGEGMAEVPNLSHRTADGAIHHNERTSRIADLDALPYPDFDAIVGWRETKSFYHRPIVPLQATRGCPFGCRFCSVIGMFGRKMRFRSPENIAGELARHAGEDVHVFFYDDNFAANPAWTKRVLNATMVDRSLCRSWSAQVRVDAARDPELLELMRDTNCTTVYIGLESVNPAALAEAGKGQNVADIAGAIQAFAAHDIDVHGMFVFGFDSDTKETIEETARFARRSGVDTVQYMLLTPLPGTPLFDEFRAQGRLTVKDWSCYDAHHVVFRPKNISPWELQWAQVKAHSRFYSRGRLFGQLAKGYAAGSLVCLYARRLNREWRRANRIYLKALRLTERARNLKLSFDFELDLSDILPQVRLAATALAGA